MTTDEMDDATQVAGLYARFRVVETYRQMMQAGAAMPGMAVRLGRAAPSL